MAAVVWFRRDLRLDDNPAWAAATMEHDTVRPLFIVDDELWLPASQRRKDLLGSHLSHLDASLKELGGRLRVERGAPVSVLAGIVRPEDAVYFNRDYTPHAMDRDASVTRAVRRVSVFDGGVVHPPGSIATTTGSPHRVFTPYWQKWQHSPFRSIAEPATAAIDGTVGTGVPGHTLIADAGEAGALARLEQFEARIDEYDQTRDVPSDDATSRLSMDLKFGTISPRRIVDTVGTDRPGARSFVRQLAWRDFYAQVLATRPDTVSNPYRSEYSGIEWSNDPDEIDAWKHGMTGYPIVDAGMRQLAAEGFMHNRTRLIVASFLVKDLLVDWRIGEAFFRHRLVDGDVAQNVGNWQWVAGTGVDAAPYFRIFNPTTQSKRFDPSGSYIRRWVPELESMPAQLIHAPWDAGAKNSKILRTVASTGYPEPIVDHAERRERTLAAYATARERTA